MGNVDVAGRVSRRSSHLRLVSLGGMGKWPLRSLDIEYTLLQADGFDREVCLRAPRERNSANIRRVCKLRAPAYELSDAPVAFHRPLRNYLVNPGESPFSGGLRFEAPSSDPRMYLIDRKPGKAVRVITTYIGA